MLLMKVSRSGVIPEPTVRVRMGEENDALSADALLLILALIRLRAQLLQCPDSGNFYFNQDDLP